MKVSTYRTKITPEGKFFPCYLMGHAIRTKPATGILDDLWATALVLEVDGEHLVWVTVELIGLTREFTDRIRSAISQKYGAAVDAVTVSFTHTHSAPEYEERRDSMIFGEGAVPGYMDWVEQQILSAVGGCFEAGFTEAELFTNKVTIDGCYGNRNGKEKPGDPSFVTLEFRSGDSVVAGAFSFACHSTVLGPQNLCVSGDLAGYAARSLKEKWGVYPVAMIGAAGDMSNRLYRRGNDEAELRRVGDQMMRQIFAAGGSGESLALHRPEIRTFRYRETFYPDPAEKRRQYDSIRDKVEHAKTFDERKVYSSALRIAEIGLKSSGPFDFDLECRYVNLGDLRLFLMPAELFARFGLQIKDAMGGRCPVCWCYSNYSAGYLADREDYGKSFETSASDIPAGTTEKIVEKAIAFIQNEHQQSGGALQ
ncbi:neutral/alkaline non-lysosomal ceramidase N-terminal domain-containing protein [Clostridium sp. KNHs216]|uniref:neutral/alkaline non-lysosomal ceramidase N-terminal domain-containing protein n=1 Tax=Clostridium sp. KNHs216 TaxID=1550235 RepID=UPI0011730357|nr:neutral/alkaline non-lysosomal ceramidase N-terminal domain-containing protein [Clostridium sp. KNHs216]TQI68347.1 neutral/alkaline ceramidase-like enzyme [Clostridium sp. KNHs216]